MLREIALDTETTGTDANNGDRIVELGCVELVNHLPTGRSFHSYLNPQRPMSAGAFNVHGLSDAFLADKPLFADIAGAFLDFIGESRLVIHNAPFDLGFLNAELVRIERRPLLAGRVLDTLAMARRKHPGASNSLDALCQRYGIDNSRRTRHGALLDAEILAEVYIELIGGRQADLALAVAGASPATPSASGIASPPSARPGPLASRLTLEALAQHEAFVARMPEGGLWAAYRGSEKE
jgi:DNA polymerase-3 subunit epsilon